jgi:hypothetical protein
VLLLARQRLHPRLPSKGNSLFVGSNLRGG